MLKIAISMGQIYLDKRNDRKKYYASTYFQDKFCYQASGSQITVRFFSDKLNSNNWYCYIQTLKRGKLNNIRVNWDRVYLTPKHLFNGFVFLRLAKI